MSDSTVVIGNKRDHAGETLYVRAEDFEGSLSHYPVTKKVLEYVYRIESATMADKTFLELLQYKHGPSMWWLMHAQVAYDINLAVSFVENFDDFLQKTRPRSVRISSHTKHTGTIKQLCKTHGILCDYSLANRIWPNLNMVRTRVRRTGASVLTHKNTQKRRKAYLEIIGDVIPDTTDKILFLVGHSYRRSIYFPKHDEMRRGEYLLSRLAELLPDSDDIIYVDYLSQITQDERILRERLESDAHCFPIEMILDDRNTTDYSPYLKRYNSLLKNPSFHNIFTYKGISIWRFLEMSFQKMSTAPYLPFWLRLIDSLDRYFETNKPRAVVIPYETGPIAQAMISAATKHHIRTIGLQHGIIHDYHYQYAKKLFYDSDTPYGFLFPSMMLLFGDATTRLLARYGYPMDRLVPFGNPTFFNMDTTLHNMANRQLHSKYGIKKHAVLVVLPGIIPNDEASHVRNYNTRVWKTMLNYAQLPNSPTILLKPHPNDDVSFYSDMQGHHKTDNARIVQGNLLELIYVSSVAVSTYSTTVFDALAMRKPVIQVTFDDADMHMPTDEYHATLKIPISRLTDTVDSLLGDDLQKSVLDGNARRFIKDYYNIPEKNPAEVLWRTIRMQESL